MTGPDEADKWWTDGLEPGTYKLRVHADKPYEQEIDLRKGERMIVELVDGTGGGIAFRRALYSDQREFAGKRAIQETGAWRLSVLADQRRRQGEDEQLHLFATLERKPDEPATERLRQVEPGRPWFRIWTPRTSSIRRPRSRSDGASGSSSPVRPGNSTSLAGSTPRPEVASPGRSSGPGGATPSPGASGTAISR